MTVSTVTAYSGTVPARSQGETVFNTNMAVWAPFVTNFATQLNVSIGQFNADVTQVNADATAAANAKTAAVAAANFVGNYSSLSGAKTAGISAKHEGAVWLLTQNTSDVTADVPGVSAKWDLMRDSGKWRFSTSGTGSAGDLLALVDDDTVAAITSTTRTLNVPATIQISADSVQHGACSVYVPDENCVVVFYTGTTGYLYCKVGTIDPATESVTWGTEQSVRAATTYSVQGCLIDGDRIFVLQLAANHPAAVVTVDGTARTVTVGSWVNMGDFSSSYSVDGAVSQVVKIASEKVAFAVKDNADTYTKCVVASISSTTITAGSEFQVQAQAVTYLGIVSLNDNEFHVFMDNSTTGIEVAQISVSGTTCSLISGPTNTDSMGGSGAALASPICCISDRENQRGYLVLQRTDTYVCSIELRNSTVDVISQVVIDTDGNATHLSAYLPLAVAQTGTIGVVSSDAGNSQYPTFYQVDVSRNGTLSIVGSPTQIEAKAANFTAAYQGCVDTEAQRFLFAYPQTTDNDVDAVLIRPAFDDSNAEKFIGIADAAFTDASSVIATINGGVNDDQSGLLVGKAYFVAKDGTLTTDRAQACAYAGKAISSTKILLGGSSL